MRNLNKVKLIKQRKMVVAKGWGWGIREMLFTGTDL